MNVLMPTFTLSLQSAVRWIGALLLCAMGLLTLITSRQLNGLEASLEQMYETRVVAMKRTQEIEHALTDFAETLLTTSTLPVQSVERLRRKTDGLKQVSLALLDSLPAKGKNAEQITARIEFESAFSNWHAEVANLINKGRQIGSITPELQQQLLKTQSRLGSTVFESLDKLTTTQLAQAKQDYNTARNSQSTLNQQFFILLAITTSLIVGALGLLVNTVRRLIGGEPKRLVSITKDIVLGNLNPDIPVAAGDKSSAMANIRVMVENLRANQTKNQNRLWIDRGLALINETVLNEHSTENLAREISQKIVQYLDIQACGLYIYAFDVVDDSMIQRQKLKLQGSSTHEDWGFPHELPLENTILRQATKESLILRNKDIPEECFHALNGAQSNGSRHFLIVPFQFENEMRGILVLKSRYQLPEHVAELMSPCSVAIGVAIESAQNRETLLASLMDSHHLTNRLQENQEELQDSQGSIEQQIQYVNGILSSVQSGLIVVDDMGKVCDCNPAMLELTGLTRKDVIGQRASMLFDEDEASLANFLFGLGQRLSRLENSHPGTFLNLLNQTPMGCLQVDSQDIIQFANNSVYRLSGYDDGELVGQPLSVLIPEIPHLQHKDIAHNAQQQENSRTTTPGQSLSLLRKDKQVVTVELGLINHDFNGQPMTLAFVRNEFDLPWSVISTTTLNQMVQDDDESIITAIKHKTKASTPVRISSTFMFSTSGIPAQTVINVYDVSSLVHKNEQIKLQHSVLEKTMDAMQDGVLRIDRTGIVLSANPKALELFGRDKVHVIGQQLEALLPTVSSDKTVLQWVPNYHEHVLQRLHDLNPDTLSKRLLDMPYPILVFDDKERVKLVNASALNLLGYDELALEGHHILALISKISLDELPQPVSLASLGQVATETMPLEWLKADQTPLADFTKFFTVNTDQGELTVACLGNSVEEIKAQTMNAEQNVEWVIQQAGSEPTPVVLTAAPLRDSHGVVTGTVITMKDMRELKEKETENLRMVKKMEQSQRLDALGQLAAGVAHDFNNLLGVIQNHAELVEMKVGEESKAAKNLSAILQATSRARDIVIKLNGLGREQPKTEDDQIEIVTLFDLLPVIDETKSLLQASLKGIEIAIEPETQDAARVQLKGESGSLQQVLVNLCVNASHAIGDRRGGRIVIRASRPQVDLVSVEVIDNGSGIPPETLPRIFEPFFTTKEVGKGTGLGLAMVRSIITRMGGNIDCKSEMGVGTRFIVTLPVGKQMNAKSTELKAVSVV